jgi:hypothetical protein
MLSTSASSLDALHAAIPLGCSILQTKSTLDMTLVVTPDTHIHPLLRAQLTACGWNIISQSHPLQGAIHVSAYSLLLQNADHSLQQLNTTYADSSEDDPRLVQLLTFRHGMPWHWKTYAWNGWARMYNQYAVQFPAVFAHYRISLLHWITYLVLPPVTLLLLTTTSSSKPARARRRSYLYMLMLSILFAVISYALVCALLPQSIFPANEGLVLATAMFCSLMIAQSTAYISRTTRATSHHPMTALIDITVMLLYVYIVLCLLTVLCWHPGTQAQLLFYSVCVLGVVIHAFLLQRNVVRFGAARTLPRITA